MKVSRKGMARGTKQTRVVLPAGRKGRNKRGTCAHKKTKLTNNYKLRMKGIQTGYPPPTRFLELEELIELMENNA
jgi:hypothetical protein